MDKMIIWMIHLDRIRWINKDSLKNIIEKAKSDLLQLEDWGINYACIINESDIPYKIIISDEEKQYFLEISQSLKKEAKIKLWICVLYNDWKATLDIAKAIDADFVRIDTFVDLVESDAWIIYPESPQIVDYQKSIGAENIILLTDIHPKYKKMLEEKTLLESALQAMKSWSNWVIITGKQSGDSVELSKLKELKWNLWSGKIYLWSWVSSENIKEYRNYIDWAFVWTYFKKDCKIDKEKVKEFVAICKNLN